MGGPAALLSPIMQLAGSGGGKGGGGGGGGAPQGGLTPQETALIDYQRRQGQLQAKSLFAKSGTGTSTMATQAVGGANIKAALQASKIAGQNRDAQTAGLLDIAKQQGALAGQTASQFGGNQGSLDQGTSTDTSGATDATA